MVGDRPNVSVRGPERELCGRQGRNGPGVGFVVRDSAGGVPEIDVSTAARIGIREARDPRQLEKGKAEGGTPIGLEPAPAEGSAG